MVKVRFLGHAAFEIVGSKRILIDPFLTGNPAAAAKPEELEADLILITHAHGDHIGDAVGIAKRTGAKIVAMYDIANYLVENNPGITTIGMNYGPTEVDGIKIVQVPAWHSSSDGKYSIGNACGYVIELDGVKIYHAGDTFVFKDMELLNELYGPIDLALLPIGGHFTMGPKEAAKAVELLKPRKVVPMHYNTWPPIAADPEEFKKLVGDKAEVIILKPGEILEL
ncbi:metal-dependent hydrolase [Thermococcus sp. GR7]|nr:MULTISPECIES: metal-dependent hydrolase [unclassified Thermococcus]NJE46850.1 metal-dependent hydrolase [Thermococcus sp. GR7]NJE78347.1 metal-dependent hydrolase [Thermococcus sp. GR4]NJF23356.1 metal-dependent hydrolase [Thermococcus sp. GR5]